MTRKNVKATAGRTKDEPTGFSPVYLFHPDRPGQKRRAGTPSQLTTFKADGWQVRKPVALTARNISDK